MSRWPLILALGALATMAACLLWPGTDALDLSLLPPATARLQALRARVTQLEEQLRSTQADLASAVADREASRKESDLENRSQVVPAEPSEPAAPSAPAVPEPAVPTTTPVAETAATAAPAPAAEPAMPSKLAAIAALPPLLRRKLMFIHITKTGGTAIEDWAKSKGIFWGRFHKQYAAVGRAGSPWHHPFPLLPAKLREQYDWFMVVRHPVDRVMSEYYCPWTGTKSPERDTEHDLNLFVQKSLDGRRPLQPGSFQPMSDYLDPSSVQHILHFESLNLELPRLLAAYGIEFDGMPHTNKAKGTKFSTKNLWVSTLEQIRRHYAQDFANFNYSMAKFLKYTGRMIYRGLCEVDAVNADGCTVSLCGDATGNFICYPISEKLRRDGRFHCNWGLCVLRRLPEGEESWTAEAKLEDIREELKAMGGNTFAGLTPLQMAERTEKIIGWCLFDRDPLESFDFSNVTLLGDAAHPLLPYGSQGATQAIMDAEALGVCYQNAMAKKTGIRGCVKELFRPALRGERQGGAGQPGDGLHRGAAGYSHGD
ncbi:unnamed protein product [Effrenium voratum]|nr:unnamed protein product [Effrenium voratum]